MRCFIDDDIVHVSGSVDPLRDIEVRGDLGEIWGRDGSVDPLRDIEGWEMRREGEIARAHLHGGDLEEIWASLWRAARSGGESTLASPAASLPESGRDQALSCARATTLT